MGIDIMTENPTSHPELLDDENRQSQLDKHMQLIGETPVSYMTSIEIYNECMLGDMGESDFDANEVLLLERKLLEAQKSGLEANIISNNFVIDEPLLIENGWVTDGHHRLAVMWEHKPYDAIPVKIVSF